LMVIGYRMVLSGYAKPGSDIQLATPNKEPKPMSREWIEAHPPGGN